MIGDGYIVRIQTSFNSLRLSSSICTGILASPLATTSSGCCYCCCSTMRRIYLVVYLYLRAHREPKVW